MLLVTNNFYKITISYTYPKISGGSLSSPFEGDKRGSYFCEAPLKLPTGNGIDPKFIIQNS